jgi:hypothetical protein
MDWVNARHAMSGLTRGRELWYPSPRARRKGNERAARGAELTDLVDGFLAGIPAPVEPEEPAADPVPPSGGIEKVGYTHEAMIDLLIARPELSQRQVAEYFGYTEAWVSQIFSSDAFQVRLAERREQLVDPAIRESLRLRFDSMVQRSLEILSEKLARPAADIPDQLALRAFELSTRAAGYGARVEPLKVDVNVNNHLELLSGNLVTLLRRKKAEVIEHDEGDPDVG